MSVVEALAREVGSVGAMLHKLSGDRWRLPTRCDPLSVFELTVHMLRGGNRLLDMLAAGAVDRQPEKDAVTNYQYDPADVGPGVVQRAQHDAEAFASPQELVRAWDERWVRALQGARAALGTDPVLPGVFGLMRLSEYLKTRVVEVTVHHMDLDDAVGRAYHPDPEALEITGDVLRGLLGTDLRPLGVEEVRFVLVGTGRAHLDPGERELLGPLAERFPLLS